MKTLISTTLINSGQLLITTQSIGFVDGAMLNMQAGLITLQTASLTMTSIGNCSFINNGILSGEAGVWVVYVPFTSSGSITVYGAAHFRGSGTFSGNVTVSSSAVFGLESMNIVLQNTAVISGVGQMTIGTFPATVYSSAQITVAAITFTSPGGVLIINGSSCLPPVTNTYPATVLTFLAKTVING